MLVRRPDVCAIDRYHIDSHYYCALLRMRALTGDHALITARDEKVVRLKPDQPYRWLRPCMQTTHLVLPKQNKNGVHFVNFAPLLERLVNRARIHNYLAPSMLHLRPSPSAPPYSSRAKPHLPDPRPANVVYVLYFTRTRRLPPTF